MLYSVLKIAYSTHTHNTYTLYVCLQIHVGSNQHLVGIQLNIVRIHKCVCIYGFAFACTNLWMFVNVIYFYTYELYSV